MSDLACPLCREQSNQLFQARGYWIRGCRTCGHEFAEITPSDSHVATIYSDNYFQNGSAGYTDYLAEGRLLRDRGRAYAKILSRHTQPGRLLDVGCAAGFTLAGFVDKGWRGVGVEPNDTMAAYGRSQLGLDVRTGTLEDLEAAGFQQVDLVNILQVLSHFIDPRSAFANAHKVLRPGGLLLVENFGRDSLARRLFGASWHEYAPPSVLHWFSRKSLAALAADYGMVLVESGRPPKWINAAHAFSAARAATQNRMMQSVFGLLADVAPQKLALPYLGDDIFYSLFRKGEA